MASGKRRISARKKDRKRRVENAIEQLSSVIDTLPKQSMKVQHSAARQIIAIGKKHGVRPNSHVKRQICRSCKKSLSPGINSRVRISSKKLIITCLECGRMIRQGPDFGGPHNG